MATHNQGSPSAQPQRYIRIRGVRTHNLKGFDLDIPHHQLIVLTGLSGSGKSSLAVDTLAAEGHRRYAESLSAYTRQFLGKIEKPPVHSIEGILPSIGLQQKSRTYNPRARVSTSTDLYPYLKLLYARIGTTYSPVSGKEVKKHTVADVVNYIQEAPAGSKVMILSPLAVLDNRTPKETLQIELGKGFSRIVQNGQTKLIEDLLQSEEPIHLANTQLVIDRLVVNPDDPDLAGRSADSAQIAFFEGQGTCIIDMQGREQHMFSDLFEADGMTFETPTPNFFNFNSPYGACTECGGWGQALGIDPNKVIPNPALSIAEGAILPWQTITMQPWKAQFVDNSVSLGFPIYKPYKNLTAAEQRIVWQGNKYVKGINAFFDFLGANAHQLHYRILNARYRGHTLCTTCSGTGLRPDAGYVKVGGRSLIDLLLMTIDELYVFFTTLSVPEHHKKVSTILLKEIINKLYYLKQVNLGYLTPNRLTNTLSGGEYQRIRLAKACGSPLVDTLYILDELTTGLHPKDIANAVEALVALLNMGNTILAVEHEETLMRRADQIIDIGPEAGEKGGYLVFQGSYDELVTQAKNSYTAEYLSGRSYIPLPKARKKWKDAITIRGIRENNLNNITVTLPLEVLTVITGVSGSGKSTLIEKIVYPALSHELKTRTLEKGSYESISGSVNKIKHLEFVEQHPVGKSNRSNPVTYLKAYDPIRKLFASQSLSVARDYSAGHFSFNVEGGRCETCLGEGMVTIEMQFMADVLITCEECQGQRFKEGVLEVTFAGKNITQVLNLTVDESIVFFAGHQTIINRLQPLQEVGLGYLRLGQPSSTFSGGEAQRMKISAYLNQEGSTTPTLFIFDEPTSGLHFHDIKKLMEALRRLIDNGHTVVIIEHHTDVIKLADWIIDLGPEAGDKGGKIMFAGTPEEMIQLTDNHTARYLKEKMMQTLEAERVIHNSSFT